MVLAGDLVGSGASLAAWAAHAGVTLLLAGAAVVDIAPWLAGRAPPPAWSAVALYYGALAGAARGRGWPRVASGVVCVATACVIAFGLPATRRGGAPTDRLRMTMFDVGQAEAVLLEPPAGLPILVDAGGSAFGSGLDIGTRVVAPALWARGVTSLGRAQCASTSISPSTPVITLNSRS